MEFRLNEVRMMLNLQAGNGLLCLAQHVIKQLGAAVTDTDALGSASVYYFLETLPHL